jgi:hypothetical protein
MILIDGYLTGGTWVDSNYSGGLICDLFYESIFNLYYY